MSSTGFRVNLLYSLNIKEFLARKRDKIWSLSNCNWTRTHNHLVHKGTLNHLVKVASLAKWLSVRLWTKWLCVRVQLHSLGRMQVFFSFKYHIKRWCSESKIVSWVKSDFVFAPLFIILRLLIHSFNRSRLYKSIIR